MRARDFRGFNRARNQQQNKKNDAEDKKFELRRCERQSKNVAKAVTDAGCGLTAR
jgi:hypothetical protein